MKAKIITGIMLTLLFVGMLTLAFNMSIVEVDGTVHMRPTGEVDPPYARFNVMEQSLCARASWSRLASEKCTPKDSN